MKILKKFGSAMLALVLCASMLFSGSETITANAAVNNATVKAAYTKFIKHKLKKNKNLNVITSYMYDFNKDGVKELILDDDSVYTYYKGKVKKLDIGNADYIGYAKGNKYIVNLWGLDCYIYEISGGKAKLVKFYKDGPKDENAIPEDENTVITDSYMEFMDKVSWDLGMPFCISKDGYYSANQIGFDLKELSKPVDTVIKKVTKNKISYYSSKWNPDTGKVISKGKTKTAKITKDTRFYCGDINVLYSGKIFTMNSKVWIKELSKSAFLKKMKTYNDPVNVVKVKNGKAEFIVIGVHIAD